MKDPTSQDGSQGTFGILLRWPRKTWADHLQEVLLHPDKFTDGQKKDAIAVPDQDE